ncbi:endonuclease/exonuclease/phosphatase family protein [Synechococcales cyanobacterium C]|uniref:Endonuclease/exonuclease/phosphatase family protein n=1 Tax=Petrachloros mirabilis ULC683 TaxID=2781853 RepID=A0A8K1ZWI0_9CYAN|nr:endonuclease/exonuclease/phosphatase family protein [Petrachloros mirabilis]NCJ05153.1 endonuclease/exonuclease/phosphatase family protein [Petrachloros mirabilis ULC683]
MLGRVLSQAAREGTLCLPGVAWPIERADQAVIESTQFSCAEITTSTLRILNWNIAKNNHQPDWLADVTQILSQVNLDLVFLQEVHLDCRQVPSLPFVNMGWHFAPNFMATNSQYFGILTASKAQHCSRRSLLTQHYEPIVQTPKVSLITEYPLAGERQTFLAVNIHAINFVSLSKFRAQLHQLEAALTHHVGPLLLSGDFNTWSRYRLRLLKAMAERLGLTHLQFEPAHRQQLKHFWVHPLDHIFYRGLAALQTEVWGHVTSSDHAPMIAEFELHT